MSAVYFPDLCRALSEVFHELSANHAGRLGEVFSRLVELVIQSDFPCISNMAGQK